MENKTIIVEYLIIAKQEDTFCDSDKSFLKFLGVDSSLDISEKDNKITITLKKQNKFSVSFALQTGLVPTRNERYFKLTLSSKERDKLHDFEELINLLEKIVLKIQTDISINVLWNDIARQYAIEGYSLINEVENLLRRLIANFMLINVGYDWAKYHIPTEVENRDVQLKTNYSDYLHQTYFSDLKTILFEGQRDFNMRNIGDVQKFVEKCISDKKTSIPIDELKGFISKSLWEKHFSKDTEYKKKDLEEDLEKLNTLRNEIAHNRHINRETLGKIQSLSKKIVKTLKLEIADLPNKILTIEEQKFQVNSENNRLAEINPVIQGYLAEQIMVEWYKSNFGVDNVHLINAKEDKGTDIIIRVSAKKRIGVQVKSTNLQGFRLIRNQIAHGLNLDRFIPRNFKEFEEFHLAVVLRDYNSTIEMPFAVELSNVLTGINPNIKLIAGYINENEQFSQIQLI